MRVAAAPGGCKVGDPVTLGVRPEQLLRADPAENGLAAEVDTVEQLGSDSYLYGRFPAGQSVTVHHPGQVSIGRRDRVALRVDPTGCHLFRRTDGEPALEPTRG